MQNSEYQQPNPQSQSRAYDQGQRPQERPEHEDSKKETAIVEDQEQVLEQTGLPCRERQQNREEGRLRPNQSSPYPRMNLNNETPQSRGVQQNDRRSQNQNVQHENRRRPPIGQYDGQGYGDENGEGREDRKRQHPGHSENQNLQQEARHPQPHKQDGRPRHGNKPGHFPQNRLSEDENVQHWNRQYPGHREEGGRRNHDEAGHLGQHRYARDQNSQQKIEHRRQENHLQPYQVNNPAPIAHQRPEVAHPPRAPRAPPIHYQHHNPPGNPPHNAHPILHELEPHMRILQAPPPLARAAPLSPGAQFPFPFPDPFPQISPQEPNSQPPSSVTTFRSQTPRPSRNLRETTHGIFPFLFFLTFSIFMTVVIIYSWTLQRPIPSKFLEGVGIVFAIVLGSWLVVILWVQIGGVRRERKILRRREIRFNRALYAGERDEHVGLDLPRHEERKRRCRVFGDKKPEIPKIIGSFGAGRHFGGMWEAVRDIFRKMGEKRGDDVEDVEKGGGFDGDERVLERRDDDRRPPRVEGGVEMRRGLPVQVRRQVDLNAIVSPSPRIPPPVLQRPDKRMGVHVEQHEIPPGTASRRSRQGHHPRSSNDEVTTINSRHRSRMRTNLSPQNTQSTVPKAHLNPSNADLPYKRPKSRIFKVTQDDLTQFMGSGKEDIHVSPPPASFQQYQAILKRTQTTLRRSNRRIRTPAIPTSPSQPSAIPPLPNNRTYTSSPEHISLVSTLRLSDTRHGIHTQYQRDSKLDLEDEDKIQHLTRSEQRFSISDDEDEVPTLISQAYPPFETIYSYNQSSIKQHFNAENEIINKISQNIFVPERSVSPVFPVPTPTQIPQDTTPTSKQTKILTSHIPKTALNTTVSAEKGYERREERQDSPTIPISLSTPPTSYKSQYSATNTITSPSNKAFDSGYDTASTQSTERYFEGFDGVGFGGQDFHNEELFRGEKGMRDSENRDGIRTVNWDEEKGGLGTGIGIGVGGKDERRRRRRRGEGRYEGFWVQVHSK